MDIEALPHMHIKRELRFPFTCPLCDEVFKEDMQKVCEFFASDTPIDDYAIHIHIVTFFACIRCGRRYQDEGEAPLQGRLLELVHSAIPAWCLCRSFAIVGNQMVGRN